MDRAVVGYAETPSGQRFIGTLYSDSHFVLIKRRLMSKIRYVFEDCCAVVAVRVCDGIIHMGTLRFAPVFSRNFAAAFFRRQTLAVEIQEILI
jgi:hypothetical protein